MRACLHGIRRLDFSTEKGKVKGIQLFISRKKDGVEGSMTEKLFIPDGFSLPPELVPGQTLDIFCDTKGRVEHVQVAPNK